MCEIIHVYVGGEHPAPCFTTIGEAIAYISRDYTPPGGHMGPCGGGA